LTDQNYGLLYTWPSILPFRPSAIVPENKLYSQLAPPWKSISICPMEKVQLLADTVGWPVESAPTETTMERLTELTDTSQEPLSEI
jgi:hypothetical protein